MFGHKSDEASATDRRSQGRGPLEVAPRQQDASVVREKEMNDFRKSDDELMSVIDTLQRPRMVATRRQGTGDD